MKNSLSLSIIAIVSIMVTINGKADPCYYTLAGVCVPSGYVLSSTPVQCYWGSGWATLYNQQITEQDAFYFYIQLVDANHPEGNTGRFGFLTITTVWYKTVTVNPSNCDITITPHAGQTDIACQSHAAGGGSYCCIVMNKPILRSFYCLAML